MRGEDRSSEPQAIDPASGFKVPYRNLVRQWDGEWVDKKFVDRRNPQDLIRVRPENPKLDHPRPEATDRFFADNIVCEDGVTPITCENGTPLLSEGPLNGAGL